MDYSTRATPLTSKTYHFSSSIAPDEQRALSRRNKDLQIRVPTGLISSAGDRLFVFLFNKNLSLNFNP
jgi:hypothetical protein